MGYTLSAGRFLREYRIIRELGSGGEGRVFLVEHVTTEQLRAAKQLPRKSGLDQVHELNMLKRLHHPSLPEVIDVLEEEDCVWLILTYIRGMSLQEFVESRAEGARVSEADFISIAGQLAEVLRYLHERKSPILHLDIKPSNLILRRDGRLVLIDFGAALRGHPGVQPEKCCGTPGFAAPEQYQKGHSLDVRTDQYGFGAVLYYLLYGSVYQPDSGKKGRQGRWMRDAEEVLETCLADEPEHRYADSGTLALAVQRIRLRSQRRRKRARLGGAFGLAMLLLGFCAGVLVKESAKQEGERRQTYEALVDEADGLGLGQAAGRYEQAARLRPADAGLYFHLLDRMLQDYRFDCEEEELIQRLLFAVLPGQQATVWEQLCAQSGDYGRLAYELGLAYWYFYEGSGGRTAAAKWFGRAVASLAEGGKDPRTDREESAADKDNSETDHEDWTAAGEQTAEWEESARIHAKISGYYGKLGRADDSGTVQAGYWELWEDLCGLWRSDSFQEEQVRIRWQVAKELVACIVMEAGELQERGEEENAVYELLEEIRMFAGTQDLEEPYGDELGKQCEAAQAAVQRAYGAAEKADTESEEQPQWQAE